MARCGMCAKGGCCFDHCCQWEVCECKDCDECLPLDVRLPHSQPRQSEIFIRSWDALGRDSKRTSDGVFYSSLHPRTESEETGRPRTGSDTAVVPGAEERKLPEPKKIAAGSAVFGIRSLKAEHK